MVTELKIGREDPVPHLDIANVVKSYGGFDVGFQIGGLGTRL